MPTQTRRPLLIPVDTLILLLLIAAAIILDTGGGIVRPWGIWLSMHNPWRPMIAALFLLAVRAWFFRGTGPFGQSWRSVAARAGLLDDLRRANGGPLPARREVLVASLGLAFVIGVALHAQLRSLYLVPDLGDPLFSMWRMGWVAHQVIADPRRLFDANIFHPERATLTFSDSMLLPAITAAPLIWAGVPLAVVYNLLFLSAFLASGIAMYVLARAVALPPPAAWIAALVFSLYPFRIDHYSHLELQMMQWMPLSLLAAHRVVVRGRVRHVIFLGLALAAQWYSSMYYGLFLTFYCGVFVCVLAIAWRPGWRRVAYAVAGLVLGVALALPLARIYKSTEKARGLRNLDVVTHYSASPMNYLQPTRRSAWYKDVHVVPRVGERDLFPNVTPLVLGAAGVVPPLNATRLALIIAGLVAFDGSLGLRGHWYPLAYAYLGPVKSVRVPARFAMLVGFTLSLLAGFGVARMLGSARTRARGRLLTALITLVFAVEALPTLTLVPVWRAPPALYAALGPGSGAVLFEFPIHSHPHYFEENLPYMYFSTWHWTKMVNGYSGNSPRRYSVLTEETAGFPRGNTVAYLQQRGVTHVTLHCALWYDEPCALTMERLAADPRFSLVMSTQWQGKPARLYELSR